MKLRYLLLLLFTAGLCGCRSNPFSSLFTRVGSALSPDKAPLPVVPDLADPLSPLTWTGGIAILGGIILITVTRFLGTPTRGVCPLFIGVGLCVGSWLLQKYADIFVVPIAVGSAVVAGVAVWISIQRFLKGQGND